MMMKMKKVVWMVEEVIMLDVVRKNKESKLGFKRDENEIITIELDGEVICESDEENMKEALCLMIEHWGEPTY